MKPIECENCGANEFIQQDDAYVCVYCNSRFLNPNTCSEDAFHFDDVYTPEPYIPSQVNKMHVQLGTAKNKWIALILCFFFGVYGGHKFYEGKIGMGILYFFTGSFCGIGWIVDLIILLLKPNPYYV